MSFEHVDGSPDYAEETVFALCYRLKWEDGLGGRLKIERLVRVSSGEEADRLVKEWISTWPASDLDRRPRRRDGKSRIAFRSACVVGVDGRGDVSEAEICQNFLRMVRSEWPFRIRLV